MFNEEPFAGVVNLVFLFCKMFPKYYYILCKLFRFKNLTSFK